MQLVEQISKSEVMVQVDSYDFKLNNDIGSDWDESIKLSKAMKVAKEPKVKSKNE